MASQLRWAWILTRALWQEWLIDQLLGHDVDAPNLTIRRCQVVHEPVLGTSGAVEDVRITTHDFLNTTAGEFDDTWIDSDFLAVESKLDTFWSAINAYRTNTIKLREYRWYKITPGVPVGGGPVRVTPKTLVGASGSGALPPQVSITVTERTPLKRHWGRFYIPGLAVNTVGTYGRIGAVPIADIATAATAMYNGILADAAGIKPVVYSPSLQSALLVREIQVDDLFDIQRRRRWETTLVRDRRALTGV